MLGWTQLSLSSRVSDISPDWRPLLHWTSSHCLCAVNLGALTLQALFEHWPSTHSPSMQEETKTVEKGGLNSLVPAPLMSFPYSWLTSGSSPAPPPQLEDMMEVCDGDAVKGWEDIGKALNIPEAKLEEISLTHKGDTEKSKEHLFKVLMLGRKKSSDGVAWYPLFRLGSKSLRMWPGRGLLRQWSLLAMMSWPRWSGRNSVLLQKLKRLLNHLQLTNLSRRKYGFHCISASQTRTPPPCLADHEIL